MGLCALHFGPLHVTYVFMMSINSDKMVKPTIIKTLLLLSLDDGGDVNATLWQVWTFGQC